MLKQIVVHIICINRAYKNCRVNQLVKSWKFNLSTHFFYKYHLDHMLNKVQSVYEIQNCYGLKKIIFLLFEIDHVFLYIWKFINFLWRKMHWSNLQIIFMIFHSFNCKLIELIINWICLCLKILNPYRVNYKNNNGLQWCHKALSHYSCKHRILIDQKNPFALLILIYISLIIKPIIQLNIFYLFMVLNK